MYIDLKAYKLFENSDSDPSWLLFFNKPTSSSVAVKDMVDVKRFHLSIFSRTSQAKRSERNEKESCSDN